MIKKINIPKVSVILTSFNHVKFLREAIDSTLSQTYENFEFIIWDDASTDDSWEIIQSYNDPRIKAFRNDEQRRGSYGINKAISEIAIGEFIAIHHSDDIWELDKLQKQVKFLEQNENIGAVFSDALAVNQIGQPHDDKNNFYARIFTQVNRTRHQWLRYFYENGNVLCHPSVLIKKKCYAECGLYRYGLAQIGDFDMWIRLLLKYEIHILSDKLVRFRILDNEMNSSGNTSSNYSRGLFEFGLILPNYLKICNGYDLTRIFPESTKHVSEVNPNYVYALAMSMLEIKSFAKVKSFALGILFNLLNEESSNIPSNLNGASYANMTQLHEPLEIKSLLDENDKINQKLTYEVNSRITENINAFNEISALKNKIAELDQALVFEVNSREAENINAFNEIQNQTKRAETAEEFAKSKVIEVEEILNNNQNYTKQ